MYPVPIRASIRMDKKYPFIVNQWLEGKAERRAHPKPMNGFGTILARSAESLPWQQRKEGWRNHGASSQWMWEPS
jgi:hypothetical protein